MKLVYLASSTLPSRGADAVHVINMCKAFAENGIEVTLIARKSNFSEDIFEYYGIKKNLFKIELVYRPNIRILGGFIYGRNVLKKFNTIEKPDVIYARSIHGLNKVYKKGIPYIFESHWIPTNKFYFNWQKKWLNDKNLISFVLISNGLKKYYDKLFSEFSNKFKIFHDASNIPNNFSVKFRKEKTLNIGFVGSFFKGNGYELIADMAKELPDHNFHIVGGSDPILSKLKSKYKDIPNLSLHGHIPFGKIMKIYEKMDIMLAPYQNNLPSLDWASPMKLFEYMAMHKPIIASDFPIMREILNENNSILVKADDIEQWCEAIASLQDINKRKILAENAYEDFIKRYTWNKRANNIISLIKDYRK